MAETQLTDNVPEILASDPADAGETEPPKKENNRAVRFKISKKVSLALGLLFAAALFAYFAVGFHFRRVFFPGTAINDVNVSWLTPGEALELLNADASEYTLTLLEADDAAEQILGSDIDLHVDDEPFLSDIVEHQDFLAWAFQSSQKKAFSLDMNYDIEKLSAVIEGLSCMDKKTWRAPEDAYITYEKGTGYQIVPDAAGTVILPDEFLTAVETALSRLDETLSLQEAGVYKLPEISSENASLQEEFSKLDPYSRMSVTYRFGSQSEVLDSSTLSEWISLDRNGTLKIDEEAAAEFVKGLSQKYNTAYSSRTLETSYGETITIKGGFYGWQIDRKAETENLLQVIRGGKSVTREPAYLLQAASHDGNDYGDTYVEINLTAQHLFFYKNGELVIETDFVSGDLSKGKETPDGSYAITYKERNSTLSGPGYSQKVSYWMPFNGNIGMHDCAWRPAFGGQIYRTNGSKGCINLPADAAKTIYENIEQGDPVFCYHLPGTEPEPPVPETPLPELPPAGGESPEQVPGLGAGDIPANAQEIPADSEPPAETPDAASPIL